MHWPSTRSAVAAAASDTLAGAAAASETLVGAAAAAAAAGAGRQSTFALVVHSGPPPWRMRPGSDGPALEATSVGKRSCRRCSQRPSRAAGAEALCTPGLADDHFAAVGLAAAEHQALEARRAIYLRNSSEGA